MRIPARRGLTIERLNLKNSPGMLSVDTVMTTARAGNTAFLENCVPWPQVTAKLNAREKIKFLLRRRAVYFDSPMDLSLLVNGLLFPPVLKMG